MLNLKSKVYIRWLRLWHLRAQIQVAELTMLYKHFSANAPLNLLIFGLGHDVPIWQKFNSGGRTVFLEDLEQWYKNITSKHEDIEAYLIKYPHDITQWRNLLNRPQDLLIELPKEVLETSWDCIFIDAPRGYRMSKDQPGRMSSIYMASQLIKKGGTIFLHDAEREVEKVYAEEFLLDDNFVKHVRGRAKLSMYEMNSLKTF